MSDRKSKSIRSTFANNMFGIAVVSIGLGLALWMHAEYTDFRSRSNNVRKEHFDAQKKMLKHQVRHTVDYINYMRRQTEKRLKSNIKDRVYEAHAIAANIYAENAGEKPLTEIQKMIKDALRPIRFHNGRGYYFAFTLDGIETLFADRPEMEGKNMLKVQGAKGEFVVRDMIDIVRRNGEGFYQYTWSKPGHETRNFPKIAFVRHFAPFDWAIGTGEYMDDVTELIQQEVLDRIVEQRFGEEGYYFGSLFDGRPLFTNGKITKGTASILDLTDPNGVKIIREQQKAAKRPGGGYVQYVWPRLNGATPSPKIAYVLAIPEWNWVIGAGVYLDTIESTIAANRTQLFNRLKNKLLKSALLLCALLFCIMFWSRRISEQIRTGINRFADFFRKAARDLSTIDPGTLGFQEFHDIADAANQMILDRKKVEAALQASEGHLRTSEARYRALVEHAGDVIFLADLETGRILDANPAAEKELGYSREALLSMNVTDIDAAHMPYSELRTVWQHLEIDKTTTVERMHERADGTTFPVEIRIGRLEMSGRQLILGLARNISKQKQLIEQLRQAHKMEAIGTLAGGIAHDFNNIISIMLGNAELALNELRHQNPARANVEEIRLASVRAKEIVGQLLSFSRKGEQKRRPLDICLIVKEALQLLRSTIPSNIEIKTRIPDTCGTINSNATEIHQIIINLCTNAAHAMEKSGGFLTVNLETAALTADDPHLPPGLPPGPYLRLTISDTGHGIPPDHLERIFDPYFTTKDVNKGSGMGLSIVHGIIKSHEGFIHADSAPGHGSTFNIYFPVIPDVPEKFTKTVQELPCGNEHILLVDDEEAVLTMLEKMLQKLGYTVYATPRPTEAVETFKRTPDAFDLLVTDMTMPVITGDVLIREIHRIRSDIPAILCTGYSERVSKDEKAIKGVTRLLNKPVNMKTLANGIRDALDRDTHADT